MNNEERIEWGRVFVYGVLLALCAIWWVGAVTIFGWIVG